MIKLEYDYTKIIGITIIGNETIKQVYSFIMEELNKPHNMNFNVPLRAVGSDPWGNVHLETYEGTYLDVSQANLSGGTIKHNGKLQIYKLFGPIGE